MQTPPPSTSLKGGHNGVLFQKSWAMLYCASYYCFFYRPNFFFYEINSFPFFSFWDMAPNTWIFTKKWPKLPKKMYIPKNCAMFWNECRTDFKIFAIFSFWDMVDFVLKVLSELWTRAVSQVKICTHPPPPSEIVRFS